MPDELLDLVDNQDQIIGTVWKSQAHQNPKLYHREIAVSIFNDQAEVLLQQRSLSKSIHPGLWTISAAGHISAGEDPATASQREVLEEIGLNIEPIYFDKFFKQRANQETRFVWIYYSQTTGHPETKLDPTEVAQISWVKIPDLELFSKTNNFPLGESSYKIIKQLASKLKL